MTAVSFDPVAGGPCDTLAQAAVHARRPFTADLVQVKLASQGDDWAEAVFYVDARAVIDRLNVLLPGRWHADYDLVDSSPPPAPGADPALVYRCRLTAAEATYADVGEGFDHKAARSDALKRAAVHIGIGHCLYRIDAIRMTRGERPHQLRGAPGALELDAANRRWLRGRYRAWLTRTGIAEYGLPLDHGRAARNLVPELFPDETTAPRARRAASSAPPPDAKSALAPKPAPDPKPAPAPKPASAPQPAPDPQPAPEPDPTLAPEPAAPPPAAAAAASAPALAAVPAAAPSPPAAPEQRAALVEMARSRGYSIATLEALARCVHGTRLDELGEGELQGVRAYLDSAAGGRVGDAELAARITQAMREASPGTRPGERLARWLLAREERAAADAA
jgi:hypothetical protein